MSPPLLTARNLSKVYRPRGFGRTGTVIHAVCGVDLDIERASTVGLVGRSGSGKSTLARLLLALESPDSGEVAFDGIPLHTISRMRLRTIRPRFQAVFQDPYGSLNPRLRIDTIIAEPLLALGRKSASEIRRQTVELLIRVGLSPDLGSVRPGSLSGGERQRVAIARALAPNPDLLVLDEPLSSLDVSIQAQILNLLVTLQEELSVAMLFISHDLALVRRLAARTAVMYAGVIVEEGSTAAVLTHPLHPYTAELLSIPGVHREPSGTATTPAGSWPPGSCAYAPTCPRATPACTLRPSLEEIGSNHRVACWHPGPA